MYKERGIVIASFMLILVIVTQDGRSTDCLHNKPRNMACPVSLPGPCFEAKTQKVCVQLTESTIYVDDFDCWQPNTTTANVECKPKVMGSLSVTSWCYDTYSCQFDDLSIPKCNYGTLVSFGSRPIYIEVPCLLNNEK